MAELDWLPPHKCGLYLEHNPHLDVYETVEQWDVSDGWVSEEEKAKAYQTNEVWRLQWYPDTPVGFYCAKASSLEAIKAYLDDLSREGGTVER